MKKKQISDGPIKLPGYRQYRERIIEHPSDILYCLANRHKVTICYRNGTKFTFKVCLGYLQQRLDPCRFCRIHNEEIINLSCVKEWHRERSIIVVNLPEDEIAFVAKRKKHEFLVSYRYFLTQVAHF